MIAPVPHAPAAGSRIRALARRDVRSVVGSQLLALDAILRRLAGVRSQLLPASARAAREIVASQTWFGFGYARASDFARERWGRTGRWLHDRAALGDAFRCFPKLEQAVTGEDGEQPIGSVAALLIARIATADSLDQWIARARRLTVRALRAEVTGSGGTPDEQETVSLTLRMPAPVRVAFEATLDLHRAVVGRNVPVAEFIDALIAESAPAALADEPARNRAVAMHTPSLPSPRIETRNAKPLFSSPAFRAALDCLARCELWTSPALPSDDSAQLERVIRELLRLEDEIETRIGALLAELDGHRAWRNFHWEGVAGYGEEYLGLSRTTAWRRASIVRRLRNLSEVQRAYLEGSIGIEAADTIQRALGAQADVATQRQWLARTRGATFKRLQDESMIALRERLLDARCTSPASDAVWHKSLRRVPGRGLAEVIGAGCHVLDAIATGSSRPDVFLNVRVPADHARDLGAAIEERRFALAHQAEHLDALPVQTESRVRPSLRIASALRCKQAGVPPWVGLLALLEEYACTWDSSPRRAADAMYERAGYRCEAPGCTSRRNLKPFPISQSQG